MIIYTNQHDYLFTILSPDKLGYPAQILELTEGRPTRIPLQADDGLNQQLKSLRRICNH